MVCAAHIGIFSYCAHQGWRWGILRPWCVSHAESARIANDGAEVNEMTEQPLDLWAERRGEVTVLVAQLSPSEALEILSRVVADATDSAMVAPVLIGCIRGVV